MASNKNAMFDNTGTQTDRIPGESGKTTLHIAPPGTDAEMLLKALRNVIIPLVRPADREYEHDANPYALGPGGDEFVIALQKFMSSFLRSQRSLVEAFEGDLNGAYRQLCHCSNALHNNPGVDSTHSEIEKAVDKPNAPDGDLSPKDAADVPPVTEPFSDRPVLKEHMSQTNLDLIEVHDQESPDRNVVSIGGSVIIGVADLIEQVRSQLMEKVLKALREHVFNTMPIRLLCFKPHGSKLQITLLERSNIYAYIASNLENNFNFELPEVSKEIARLKTLTFVSSERAEQMPIQSLIQKYSKYAILSHTWLRDASGEVTYGDWIRGEFDAQQLGYHKLLNFCQAAWNDHEVAFGWMDTVCINKESSAELDESIRSMYKWYQHAHICITYLAQTVTLSDMSNDTWFTRGWTLQELFAPFCIKFYSTNWNKVVESSENDKENSIIQKQIEQAMGITADELAEHIRRLPISRRMQMAAKREVTREEDSAYSLMGIFDVSISIAYGEGSERAFSRLLQEILSSSQDVADIFNWAGSFDDSRISALLPSTPRGYLHRSSHHQRSPWNRPIEPFMLTHLGLRVTVILMPAISIQNPTLRYKSIGNYHAIADIPILTNRTKVCGRDGGSYSVLDAKISRHEPDGWNEEKNGYQLTLGILNIRSEDNSTIWVPFRCFAVGLDCYSGDTSKIPTEAPIIFALHHNRRRSHECNHESHVQFTGDTYNVIERSELESHGMKLATLYL